MRLHTHIPMQRESIYSRPINRQTSWKPRSYQRLGGTLLARKVSKQVGHGENANELSVPAFGMVIVFVPFHNHHSLVIMLRVALEVDSLYESVFMNMHTFLQQ